MKRFLIIILASVFLIALSPFLISKLISFTSGKKIYTDHAQLPDYPLVMVLGAGRYYPESTENYFFTNRMSAAYHVFLQKKIKRIIASGRSNIKHYSEPAAMKSALVDSGVPPLIIYPDHGGDRTFNSVRRIKEYFHADSVIIVSQREQLERALFISKCFGITAVGYEAKDAPYYYKKRFTLREYLARMKTVWDCFFYS